MGKTKIQGATLFYIGNGCFFVGQLLDYLTKHHVPLFLIKPNNPLINVDFPAPFGPIIPVILPEGIVTWILFKAVRP